MNSFYPYNRSNDERFLHTPHLRVFTFQAFWFIIGYIKLICILLSDCLDIIMKKKRILHILAIGIPVYLLLLCILVIAENPEEGTIHSFFDAFWYSIVTISTVGYGDLFPISLVGKIIAFIFIVFSIGMLGLIIGQITNMFRKHSEKRRLGLMGTDFSNHIIIIGWDAFAEDVAIQLINSDKKVAVMTCNKDDIDLIPQNFNPKQLFVCFSDLKNYDSLNLLNIQKANVVFLNSGSDSDKLISIINIRKIYPQVEFVVILENSDLKDTFVNAGVTYVLSKNEIASKLVASYIFEPAVADYTKDLITSTNNESEYDIQQYKINDTNPYKGSAYGDMFIDLKNKYNIIAIGLNKSCTSRLLKVPSDHETVEYGDDVIVIANGATEIIMQKLFKVTEGK